MKCCCVKMADEVVGKSRSNGSITKARTTFSEEQTENLISLWSEEEVLFSHFVRLDKQGKPIYKKLIA